MTQASAPGKIVLWGEYAVLAGAPAGVLALDTFANVTASSSRDNHWHFSSAGFNANTASCEPRELPGQPVAGFIKAILEHWEVTSLHQCASPLSIHTDSSAFFAGSQKLGLGSSAAVCTATYLLLCELTRRKATLTEAMAIHKHWQGGKGSGLDIASVWHGGFIHFRAGSASPATLPADLHWQIIFSGQSADTTNHIASFDAWQQKANTMPLDNLVKVSTDLCAGSPRLADLACYCEALKTFDESANLNIFTHEHTRLGTLAAASGVLYKPCGAGGGDIGIGFSDDPGALAVFRQRAAEDGFLPLDLEMASHGVALEHG
jgi:phosphomevalonate kinase